MVTADGDDVERDEDFYSDTFGRLSLEDLELMRVVLRIFELDPQPEQVERVLRETKGLIGRVQAGRELGTGEG